LSLIRVIYINLIIGDAEIATPSQTLIEASPTVPSEPIHKSSLSNEPDELGMMAK